MESMLGFWWYVFVQALDDAGQNLSWTISSTLVGIVGVGFSNKWNGSELKRHIRKNILYSGLVALVTLSPFLAATPYHLWKAEHDAASAAIQNAPQLVGSVDELNWLDNKDNHAEAVLITMSVTNYGSDSVADGFHLLVKHHGRTGVL